MKLGEHYAPMKLIHHPDPDIRYVAVKVDCPCGQLDCPINNKEVKMEKEYDIVNACALFVLIIVGSITLWFLG